MVLYLYFLRYLITLKYAKVNPVTELGKASGNLPKVRAACGTRYLLLMYRFNPEYWNI